MHFHYAKVEGEFKHDIETVFKDGKTTDRASYSVIPMHRDEGIWWIGGIQYSINSIHFLIQS